MSFEVRHYFTASGADPFAQWIEALRDRQAQARIVKRIDLLLLGGDKRKQDADIKQAKEHWHDYQQRSKAPDGHTR